MHHSTVPVGALSDVTVLDLTHYVAGPYCTKLMAAFGATVIKVERPGAGDPTRKVGPFVPGAREPESSIPFLWLNLGKRSITLDLKQEAGRRIFMELVGRVDVVVENFSPRVLPSLMLGYDVLRELNPGLIMTSISNFGQSGPYRDYRAEEIVEYALAGLMYLTGDPDKPPLAAAPAMTQYTAGMCAYIATLIALYQQGSGATGQHVDVSIQECALDNIEVALVEYLHSGRVARRTGDEHALVPWQLYPCKDGYAAVIGGPMRLWSQAAPVFEEPELQSLKYRHVANRMQHRAEVTTLLQPWLDAHLKRDIYHAGQSRGLAFGYLATLDEVLSSTQLRARNYFVEIDHPATGPQPYCGPSFRPGGPTRESVRAPLLGEHTEDVLRTLLGHGATEVQSWREQGVV